MYYLADNYVMVIHSLKTVFIVALNGFLAVLKLDHERFHLAKIALERNTISGGNVMLSKQYLI